MLPCMLKIDSTHQYENDEMDAVDLYSCKKCCQCHAILHTVFCDIDTNILS